MLSEFIEKSGENVFTKFQSQLATKEDISKPETKFAETKSETLKWMFVFFSPFYVGMIVFLVKNFL